jgi:hypothetical protein
MRELLTVQFQASLVPNHYYRFFAYYSCVFFVVAEKNALSFKFSGHLQCLILVHSLVFAESSLDVSKSVPLFNLTNSDFLIETLLDPTLLDLI